MAKINKALKISSSRRCRVSPCSVQSRPVKVKKDIQRNKILKSLEKKVWKHASCSVCMEHPHNAVLLLCSSYNKGCRPYMCATGTRYSNCLEQYKGAYTNDTPTHIMKPIESHVIGFDNEKIGSSELLCPLCRGQMKGWTVVKSARKYLNGKRRTCARDKCSFVGTYKELKNHVKSEHPRARPREVDPLRAEKWKKLEREREHQDVISTIRSSMPGSIVVGDYVIERPLHIFAGFGGGGGENGYLSWDDSDDDMAIDHRGNVGALGNIGNNFFFRLWRNGNRALSGGLRGRRHRPSGRG